MKTVLLAAVGLAGATLMVGPIAYFRTHQRRRSRSRPPLLRVRRSVRGVLPADSPLSRHRRAGPGTTGPIRPQPASTRRSARRPSCSARRCRLRDDHSSPASCSRHWGYRPRRFLVPRDRSRVFQRHVRQVIHDAESRLRFPSRAVRRDRVLRTDRTVPLNVTTPDSVGCRSISRAWTRSSSVILDLILAVNAPSFRASPARLANSAVFSPAFAPLP